MDETESKSEVDAEHLEKVRRRAHAIWMDQGQVHGRHEEHWHEAEREIAAEKASAKAADVAVDKIVNTPTIAPATTIPPMSKDTAKKELPILSKAS